MGVSFDRDFRIVFKKTCCQGLFILIASRSTTEVILWTTVNGTFGGYRLAAPWFRPHDLNAVPTVVVAMSSVSVAETV
jgi:hypothetical protein